MILWAAACKLCLPECLLLTALRSRRVEVLQPTTFKEISWLGEGNRLFQIDFKSTKIGSCQKRSGTSNNIFVILQLLHVCKWFRKIKITFCMYKITIKRGFNNSKSILIVWKLHFRVENQTLNQFYKVVFHSNFKYGKSNFNYFKITSKHALNLAGLHFVGQVEVF